MIRRFFENLKRLRVPATSPHATGAALLAGVVYLTAAIGCRTETVVPQSTSNDASSLHDDELFNYAVENLNRLAEFNPHEILGQVIDRLNQWSPGDTSTMPWQPDPLISTLPQQTQAGVLAQLNATKYTPYDGVYLREAVILRNIARHACGDTFDDLDRARRLFDWTVNNIDLDDEPSDDDPVLAQMPWHTVLFGHGRSIDRAWVFMLLARQQNLDVVLLTIPSDEDPRLQRVWCTALFTGGQLYLFDQTYGLPVPGPDGHSIATLQQVLDDQDLLKQMDYPDAPYPIRPGEISRVNVFVEAGSQCLAQRMKRIETRLSGQQHLVLTCRPSDIAKRLEDLPHVGRVRIWPWPYEATRLFAGDDSPSRQAVTREMHPFEKLRSGVVNPLWSGRLRQFEGRFAGQGDGPLSTDPNDGAGPTGSAGQEGAKASYLSARMLLSDLVGKNIPDEFKDRYEALQQRAQLMKGHATYWLGLISLEEQKYDLAEYYFDECLKNWPQGRWQSAATFALARSYEASGRTDKAIEKYQELRGLAALGARLRAKRLGAVTPDAGDQEPTKEETDAADDGEGTPPEKDPETE